METLDSDAIASVVRRGGSWSAAGEAGARHSSAAPAGAARTGAKALPVLPHWTDPAAPWLCVEHRADSGAHVRLDLRRLGYEVHWPRETVRIRGRDDVLRPYFPGYLFALPAAINCSWHAVKERAQHVVQILGLREHGRPAHPPAGFVLGLIDLAGGAIDGVIPAPEDAIAALRPGDPVKVRGAYDGVDLVFHAERGKRIELMLTILGVPRVVSVSADRVVRRA
jgi:hypothetical protein